MKRITLAWCLMLMACAISAQSTIGNPPKRHHASAEALRFDKLQQQFLAEWKDSVRAALLGTCQSKTLQQGSRQMKMDWHVYGNNPGDGLSLFISLHGGGGTAPEVNDSQWRNQLMLYRPANAVYLCPRSIQDTWDMHFVPETDAFYQHIIMMAVACLDVNPNKIYLLGYSAGGDGVWRLAPRMADTWAAASMMAGHPGDVSLVNLRNTPFMIWCGELDAAYERNLRCKERIAEMDSLHQQDPSGYIFEGHMQKGKGHWMDLTDAASLQWMASHQRNPYPTRIVWRQEEVTRPHFYWLSAPTDELQRGKEVRAHIDGNTIHLTKCDYTTLTLSLNDQMVDLDRPITVKYLGKRIFKGKVKRLQSTLRQTLYTRNDPAYMFPAQVNVTIPQP